jgi:hypothetical protein
MSVNPSFGPRVIYPNFSKTVSVSSGSGSTTASTLVTGNTGWTIFVTKITVSVTQDGASAIKFSDTTGSLIFTHPAAPGLVRLEADFGDGLALTESYGLQYNFTTAGTALACKAVVEGYIKATTPQTQAAFAAAVLP